jgi:cytochrome c biogenesis protein CcmG, thiol:disulfide interchange protein DsbE
MGRSDASGARAVVLVTVVLALSFPACHGSGGSLTALGPPARNATGSSLLPTTVLAFPSFDFDGFERLLYGLRGTPVVVNIWASWCGPCQAEAPALADAARRYGHDVQFLGVDIQDSKDAAAAYVNEHGLPYPSVFDASGEIHDRLGFVGLPDTVFYGADGQISATWTGPISGDALRDEIRPLLGQSASGGSRTSPT